MVKRFELNKFVLILGRFSVMTIVVISNFNWPGSYTYDYKLRIQCKGLPCITSLPGSYWGFVVVVQKAMLQTRSFSIKGHSK